MRDLRGKNAVLTGASRGVGVYIARYLAAEGVDLALAARNSEQLDDVCRDLAKIGRRAVAIPTDVTREEDLDNLVAEARRQLGDIDILVNNAGIVDWAHFAEHDPARISDILDTDLMAPLILARKLLPGMLARRSGHIVSVASLTGKAGIPYTAVYSAAKAGLIQWSRALRMELEDTGVRVSCVIPGVIAEAGMAADRGLPAPWLTGAVRPEAVAKAVVRALRSNRREIIVRKGPTRPWLALGELWPALGDELLKMSGVVGLHRAHADEDRDSGPRRTP